MEKPYAPYPCDPVHGPSSSRSTSSSKASDPNTAPFNNAPVGTGPFKWVERVPGDHITLAANTDYFGEGPYLERLIFKYMPDLTVLYTQFQTGDIDYIGLQGITADHYDEAKKLADRVVTPVPQPFIENIAFNLGHAGSSRTRRCARRSTTAMDKQSDHRRRSITACRSRPNPSCRSSPGPSIPICPSTSTTRRRPRRSWTRPAGSAGSDGVREKNGVRLEFANSTTAGNHVREQAQQLLQQNWQDIGVKMTINNLPRRRHVGRLLDDVEVRDGHGRHRLHDRPRSRRQRLLRQQVDRRPGRHRRRTPASTATPRSTSCCRREPARSTAPSARRSIARCRRSPATTCPTCRSSSTRRWRASRRASRASSPTSTSRRTPGTADQWYWAS